MYPFSSKPLLQFHAEKGAISSTFFPIHYVYNTSIECLTIASQGAILRAMIVEVALSPNDTVTHCFVLL